ncbi:Chromosomal replication initiator protein DnaA [Bacteroidales bacterium Barb6]|nr:Chromosomal replication initiator protein DnaA [Bacteroidales bacterium Barb6]
MQSDYKEIWNKCLAIIKDTVSEVAFNTWFMPILPLSYEDNKFTIQVPSQFFFEYLEANYIDVLKVAMHRVIGQGIVLNYRVTVTNGATVDYQTDNAGTAVRPNSKKDAAKTPTPFTQIVQQDWDPQLNPKYNFDNFFEGKSNRLGRSAAEEVAKNPAKTAFNPLFLYGPSGVGKTHLCYAIGGRIRKLYPEKKVLYVSSHLFRVQFTEATRKNTTNDFINFYQNVDVLLLDDIQELIGMEKTQNTFFHIFNHLHQLGKQLVLTSDKAPVDLFGIEERLITRMKWGLTAELKRPDLELRRKIVRNKIDRDGLVIPDDVFEFIVGNVTDNVRDIEGVLVSLMAHSVVNNKEINLPLAKRVITQTVRVEKKKLSVDKIQKVVCKYFDLEEYLIQTPSRKREIVQARHIAMYLSKKYTDNSFSYIGTVIGKKDHSTVLHACQTVKNQMEADKTIRTSVEQIEALLNS